MYLDDFACTEEYVTITLKQHNHTREMCMERPCEMWDAVWGQFVPYCSTDADKLFRGSIGDEIEVTCHLKDGIAHVTFARLDGYQIAVIKFKMEE